MLGRPRQSWSEGRVKFRSLGMQRGLTQGRVGPTVRPAYQNRTGAGAGLAVGGAGSCMHPAQGPRWHMCECPRAATANDHKRGGLKTQKCKKKKNTEIYSLSVLEARNQKSRCPQSRSLWREHLLQASLLASSVAGNPRHPWLKVASLQSLPPITWPSLCVSVCPLFFL